MFKLVQYQIVLAAAAVLVTVRPLDAPVTSSVSGLMTGTSTSIDISVTQPHLAPNTSLVSELESISVGSPCQYRRKLQKRDDLFFVGNYSLPLMILELALFSSSTQLGRSCFFTRQDFENHLNKESGPDIIQLFSIVCPQPASTRIFFQEEMWGDRSYTRYVSYFQVKECMISMSLIKYIAGITELRVLTLVGNGSWDLDQLSSDPSLCLAFRNVVSLSVQNNWKQDLHLLAYCQGHLDGVVELSLINNSIHAFPSQLHFTLPNLRSLDIGSNNLSRPIPFPWKPGYAVLPRNLSRTFQYNQQYSLYQGIDIEANLFRRMYVLDNNRIENLTAFQFHSDFQYISIQQNGIKNIDSQMFNKATNIQFLSLAYNQLETLPQGLFGSLSLLKKLELQGNKLKSLPSELFHNLRQLRYLNLANNRLEEVQEAVFARLEQLTELRLQNNHLVQFNDGSLSTLSISLKLLDLRYNPLQAMPVIIFQMHGLTNISLDHTNLTVLDFVDIDNRTDLSIIRASLRNPTVGDFFNEQKPEFQRTVSLSNSPIGSVVVYNATSDTYATFALLTQYYSFVLDSLKCDCNILNVTHLVTNSLQKLNGQERVVVNWKCAWPTELVDRSVLSLKDEETYCSLNNSPANDSCPTRCQCYIRTRIHSIIVDCQNRALTSLPESVPSNTVEVWMQNNSLQTLSAVPYLHKLKVLKLTSNNVQKLSMDVLSSLQELEVLYLDNNWLTGLEADFAYLSKLQDVRLAGNPFRCDCHTRWIPSWLLQNAQKVKDWGKVKCSTEKTEGRLLTSVPEEEFFCQMSASLADLAILIAVPVILAFMLLTLIVICFLHRRRLKLLLYVYTGLHPFDRDPPDHSVLFDVAVCCDVQSREWVWKNIVIVLESIQECKVFFYSRNAFLGLTTSENVHYCIKNSRRLVAVLGEEWQSDDSLVLALQEGLIKSRSQMVHFVLAVVHGNFSPTQIVGSNYRELREYIKKNRYIKSSDRHFIHKLLYEMPHHIRLSVARNSRHLCVDAGHRDMSQEDHNLTQINMNEITPRLGKYRCTSSLADYNSPRLTQSHTSASSRTQQGKEVDDEVIMNSQSRPMTTPVSCQAILMTTPASSFHPQTVSDWETQCSAKSVFVWYTASDLEFVLERLVQPLEKWGHTCILQDRDFCLGAAIQENIVHAADCCTRAVFVLSDATSRDDWSTFVFHVLFDRQSRQNHVVLLAREGVNISQFTDDLKQVFKTTTCLSENDPWFLQRLQNFMEFDGDQAISS